MSWLVVRTDLAKEAVVAAAIERAGWPVWLPTEVRHFRTSQNRRIAHRTVIERPLMPKCLFAAVSPHEVAFLQRVRHFQGVMRDMEQLPIVIPDFQLTRFRDRIEDVNARERQRIENMNRKGKRVKTFRLDPEQLALLKQELFGKGMVMEDAA